MKSNPTFLGSSHYRSLACRLTLAGLAALLSGYSAHAASQTWNSTGASAAWNSTTNWGGVTAPGNTSSSGTTTTDVATFNTAVGAVGVSGNPITIDTGRTIGGITFDTANVGSFFIGSTSGNTLYLSSGGNIQMTATAIASNETINAPLAIGTGATAATYTIQNNSTSTGALTIGGSVASQTSGTVTLTLAGTNSGANSVSGIIGNGNGTLAISKSGAGNWTLSNADTYSGGTAVSAGTLTVTNAGGLGTGTVSMNGGALNLAIDGAGSNGTISVGNNIAFGGSKSGTINVGPNSTSNTGNTIQLGSLSLSSSTLLVTNEDGYNLTFTGSGTMASGDTVTNNMVNGTLTLPSFTDSDTTSGRTLNFNGTSASAVTIVGAVGQGTGSNVIGVTQAGYGTLRMTGTNTYTGATTVYSGSLVLANGSGAALASSTLTLAGGTFADFGTSTTAPTIPTSTITLGSNVVTTSSATGHVLGLGSVVRAGGSVVDFQPFTSTASAAGSMTTTTGNNTAGILGGWATYNGTDWATVIGGTISQYTGYTTLNVTSGSATNTNYILNNASTTLTGTLSINSLKINDSGSTDSLALNGKSLNFSATSGGLLMTGGGTYTISGSGVLGAGTASEFIINVAGGSTLDISSTLISSTGQAGLLTKAGSGTLVLTGSNGYSSVTTIDAGVLSANLLANEGTVSGIGTGANGGNLASNLVINGGTLQYTGSGASTNRNFTLGASGGEIDSSGTGAVSFTGTMTTLGSGNGLGFTEILTLGGSNTGSNTISNGMGNYTGNGSNVMAGVTKTGVGTWVLAGTNSYTAATTVNGGILQVTGSTAAASAVTVNTGGALGGTGTVGGTVLVNTGGGINLRDGAIGTLTTGNLTIGTGTGTALTFDITSGSSGNLDKVAAGTLTIGGTSGITVNVENEIGALTSGTTLTTGTYTLVSYTGTQLSTAAFNNFSLSNTSVDGDTLSLLNGTNALELVITSSGPSFTTGTYTLATTAGASLLHSGATTTLTTTLTNTGSGTADSLTVNGLGATSTGGTVSSGTVNSSSPIVQTGTLQNTGQTFTAGTAGSQTVTGTVTSVTGANSTGAATQAGNTGASIFVYSGVGVWNTNGGGSWGTTPTATPANWTANGGIPGITSGFTTTDSASFGSVTTSGTATVTLDGASPFLNAITFNDSAASYDIEQGTGGTIHLDSTTTATVTVSAGSDTIGAPVELDSAAATSVAGGSTLAVNGAISQSGTQSMTVNGPGTTVFTGNNTYTGGTSVASGSLFLNNTAGSGAGTGSLTVAAGATLGGTGSYGTSGNKGAGFSIAGTGTATGSRANVLVGMASAADTNTTASLTMLASSTATITNANLTFNINSQVAGQGTELNVGSTLVAFGAGVQSTTLTLNVENAGVINGSPLYVLIAGNTSGAVDQYSGLSLGTGVGNIATGLLTPILNSGVGQSGNLTLALTGLANSWYGAHSELFLYQNSGTGADDIEVEVVPEPGTWALMLGGLAFLVFWQRRKSRS